MSDPLLKTLYDANKTCRACLKDEIILISLINSYLWDIFIKFTNLEVLVDDGLPSKLCLYCVEKLNNSSLFLELCIKSDNILKQQKVIKAEKGEDINAENLESPVVNDVCVNNFLEVNYAAKEETDERSIKEENVPVATEDNTNSDADDAHFTDREENVLEKQVNVKKSYKKRLKSAKKRADIKNKRLSRKQKSNSVERSTLNCAAPDYNLYLICPRCGESFTKSDRLEAHYRVHLGKKPEVCDICNKEFSKPERLQAHLLQHSKNDPICSKCGEKFDSTEALRIHKKSHAESRSLICHICGNSVGKSLKSHMTLKHCDRKPFACNLCPKAFKNATLLKTHLLRHADIKKYICSICGHRALRKWDLEKHMTSHSDDKPFACKFCPKRYKTNQYLTQHNKVHTGERPYKCDLCPMSFRASTVLKNHRMLHTGEKPHVCRVCSKAFTQKIALVSHMKVHGSLMN